VWTAIAGAAVVALLFAIPAWGDGNWLFSGTSLFVMSVFFNALFWSAGLATIRFVIEVWLWRRAPIATGAASVNAPDVQGMKED
jgi:hypothetical protein